MIKKTVSMIVLTLMFLILIGFILLAYYPKLLAYHPKIEEENQDITVNNFQDIPNTVNTNSQSMIWFVQHQLHTIFDDGAMTINATIHWMLNWSDAGAITTHDINLNEIEWQEVNTSTALYDSDNPNYTLFWGTEWGSSIISEDTYSGHVYYFIKDNYAPTTQKDSDDTDFNEISELCAYLDKYTGVGAHAHPAGNFRNNWSNPSFSNDSCIRTIEIFNAGHYYWDYYWNCSEDSGCTTSENPDSILIGDISVDDTGWVKYGLDQGLHWGFVAVADSHSAANVVFLKGRTGLYNATNTRDSIFDAYWNRHIWATETRTIMKVTSHNGSGGEFYVMGDIFSTDKKEIYINYSINASGGKIINTTNVFVDGIIRNHTTGYGIQNITGYYLYTFTDNNEHYIFIESIEDGDSKRGGPRSWSSPMYITSTADMGVRD